MYNYRMYSTDKADIIEKIISNSFSLEFWEPLLELLRTEPERDIIIILFTVGDCPIGLIAMLQEEDETFLDRMEIATGHKNQGHGTKILDVLKSIYNGTNIQGYAIAPSARFWAKNSSDCDTRVLNRYVEQHEGSDNYLFDMDGKLMWFEL